MDVAHALPCERWLLTAEIQADTIRAAMAARALRYLVTVAVAVAVLPFRGLASERKGAEHVPVPASPAHSRSDLPAGLRCLHASVLSGPTPVPRRKVLGHVNCEAGHAAAVKGQQCGPVTTPLPRVTPALSQVERPLHGFPRPGKSTPLIPSCRTVSRQYHPVPPHPPAPPGPDPCGTTGAMTTSAAAPPFPPAPDVPACPPLPP